jgi:deazaflavin-dependent oxidoreductase (nitroreductase family)
MDIEAAAADSPMPWAAEHARQYLATNGTEVDHPFADRLLLLYTTGRKSGTIRRIPLVHLDDGDDLLVVASAGGSPTHPAWYRNLVADPHVWVRLGSGFFPATATSLVSPEREDAWDRIVAVMPFFADYQARVEREIPVVRLRRCLADSSIAEPPE